MDVSNRNKGAVSGDHKGEDSARFGRLLSGVWIRHPGEFQREWWVSLAIVLVQTGRAAGGDESQVRSKRRGQMYRMKA